MKKYFTLAAAANWRKTLPAGSSTRLGVRTSPFWHVVSSCLYNQITILLRACGTDVNSNDEGIFSVHS